MKVRSVENKAATIKFFNFDLDHSTLKKLLDLYAWVSVVEVLVFFIFWIIFYPKKYIEADMNTTYVVTATGFIFAVMTCFVYFFRYSVYMHGSLILFTILIIYFDTLRFNQIIHDFSLLEQIAKFRIDGEKLNAQLVEYAFFDVEKLALWLPVYCSFFYFAYGYRKLKLRK
jgi:hypothetical protein